ncbi:hypothetical protein EPUL_004272 [Erysiphe pulchra]|uniref:ATP-dependent DNA helicase n=1 Tax=Erysiphe pulchra TaxID=225359 RepID=A0A2S4PQJ3_9PEZI|nr:hypothetical protein EPUL_004272 [Erysiphe pulchra]
MSFSIRMEIRDIGGKFDLGLRCSECMETKKILPVVKRGGQHEIFNACIRCWNNWLKIRVLFLTQNMRVTLGESNRRFASWFDDLLHNQNLYGVIEFPEWIKITDDRAFFREFVYPVHLLRAADSSIFRDFAILTSRNDNVQSFQL